MMYYIIGIDLGGTNLRIGLFDRKYQLRTKKIFVTERFKTKEKLIQAIVKAVGTIIKGYRLNKKGMLGLGIGFPGPVDCRKGIVHFLPNIPGWKDVSIKKILEKKLGINVFLDNDANLMCLAEYKMGAAKGFKNIVCITLGTGVGGGMIIAGKLYRGEAGVAGEIGHIPVNETGPACNCGGRACLESYVGNRRLTEQAKKVFQKKISLEELGRLAVCGNRKAIKIWQEMGEKIGLVLSGVINLLNPDCIIIGGGLSKAGRFLFRSIRETISKRAMAVQANHVKVLQAKFINDGGMIGAAVLVGEKGL
jgi:glucokinase